jgi:hypothetical protein
MKMKKLKRPWEGKAKLDMTRSCLNINPIAVEIGFAIP